MNGSSLNNNLNDAFVTKKIKYAYESIGLLPKSQTADTVQS